MAQFSRTVHIDVPPASVFAFVAGRIRVGRLARHLQVLRVEAENGRPRAVHLLVTPPGMRPMELVADVAAFEPNQVIVLRSLPPSHGLQFNLRYACVPVGAGTDLTCDIDITMGGLAGRFLGPLLTRNLAQYAGQALDVAKVELERA